MASKEEKAARRAAQQSTTTGSTSEQPPEDTDSSEGKDSSEESTASTEESTAGATSGGENGAVDDASQSSAATNEGGPMSPVTELSGESAVFSAAPVTVNTGIMDSTVVSTAVTESPAPEVEAVLSASVAVPVSSNVADDQVVLNTLEERMTKIESSAGKVVLTNLQEYAVSMNALKPQSNDTIMRQQRKLWQTLSIALTLDGDVFLQVWAGILAGFAVGESGVFADENVFRGMEYIDLSTEQTKQFQRLLNLIRVTADPRSRAVSMRQVDMNKTLDGFSESAVNNLQAFYQPFLNS